LKSKRDEYAFKEAAFELKKVEELVEANYLDLVYYDETGFSLTSSIPYAWQEKGKTIEIPASKSKRINVAGFLSSNGKDFQGYQKEGSIKSADVVGFFDDFAKHIKQPTLVVLDNASTHRSADFQAKIEQWKEQDLHLYFLPPYSPELNKIEILWRKMKYEWINFDAFSSFQSLRVRLNELIEQIGEKYIINYG
jgi:transposase